MREGGREEQGGNQIKSENHEIKRTGIDDWVNTEEGRQEEKTKGDGRRKERKSTCTPPATCNFNHPHCNVKQETHLPTNLAHQSNGLIKHAPSVIGSLSSAASPIRVTFHALDEHLRSEGGFWTICVAI